MTDYSTFNSSNSTSSSFSVSNSMNSNIFGITHNDFTNTPHHNFNQFYNQTQHVYNQLNTDTFAHHHQIPISSSYKNIQSYGASNQWKHFPVQNSSSSASSSPHIDSNSNTQNNSCLPVQSDTFHSGKTVLQRCYIYFVYFASNYFAVKLPNNHSSVRHVKCTLEIMCPRIFFNMILNRLIHISERALCVCGILTRLFQKNPFTKFDHTNLCTP